MIGYRYCERMFWLQIPTILKQLKAHYRELNWIIIYRNTLITDEITQKLENLRYKLQKQVIGWLLEWKTRASMIWNLLLDFNPSPSLHFPAPFPSSSSLHFTHSLVTLSVLRAARALRPLRLQWSLVGQRNERSREMERVILSFLSNHQLLLTLSLLLRDRRQTTLLVSHTLSHVGAVRECVEWGELFIGKLSLSWE